MPRPSVRASTCASACASTGGTRAARSPSASEPSSSACRPSRRFDVAFRLKQNRWNGTVAPQLVVRRVFDTSDAYEELRTWLAELWRAGEDGVDARGPPDLRRARDRRSDRGSGSCSSPRRSGRCSRTARRSRCRRRRRAPSRRRERPSDVLALAPAGCGADGPRDRPLELGEEPEHAAALEVAAERAHGPSLFGRPARDPVTRKGASRLRAWPSSMRNVIRTTSSVS